jgi:lipopolysaccharide/colanic/teichoic acid biosynthesis glycosyltransferase
MIKRAFDILVSMCLLIILAPLLLIVGFCVYFKLGSPIFFTQERPGKYGKIFRIIKFRTMLDLKDEKGELLPNEQRLTRFGKILRSTSLDELPQLINVLKGDMSLVGPRPLLVQYLPLYSEEQMKRHNVRPGITGYAQIKGRNSLTWTEKFKLDLWYVENVTFWLDLKILFLTIYKVIKREGISQSESVTMENFTGRN